MKVRHKLLWRMILITSVFYIITIAAASYALYSGSTKVYLSSRNEMMEQEFKNQLSFLDDFHGLEWYFEYWHEHPDQVQNKSTDPDLDMLSESYWVYDSKDEDQIVKNLSSLSSEAQLCMARETYSLLKGQFDYNADINNNTRMYLMSVDDDSAFLYTMSGNGEIDEHKLGERWDFDISDHPAVKKVLDKTNAFAEYEITEHDPIDGKSYYTGYVPITENGKSRVMMCISYNWDALRNKVYTNLRLMTAVMIGMMIVSWVVIVFAINRLSVRPVRILQKAVSKYVETKDHNTVSELVGSIKTGSEIGALAHDVESLSIEMDKYIADLRQANSDNEKLSDEVMEALAHTIDAKDKYTNGHSTRVAIYSRMLAVHLDLPGEEQKEIYNMGLLHDIGKIGVPSSIINKTTRLTDEEYEMIKTHPVVGYEILSEISSKPDLAYAARWHHERYDGRGYPDGLAGEKIPFYARIIAVVDCYDAMTSTRSYRDYLPQKVVRDEIEKNIGTQFDPVVAKAMLEIIDNDKGYAFHE